MEAIFLVYKTDNQHSFKSRDIIGAVDSADEVINICQLQAKKEGCVITSDQLFNVNNYHQTQGYEGAGEFATERVILNTLL